MPPAEYEPGSPAALYTAGRAHLEEALTLAQQAGAVPALAPMATMRASIATAHFAAANAGFAFVRERLAEQAARAAEPEADPQPPPDQPPFGGFG